MTPDEIKRQAIADFASKMQKILKPNFWNNRNLSVPATAKKFKVAVKEWKKAIQ